MTDPKSWDEEACDFCKGHWSITMNYCTCSPKVMALKARRRPITLPVGVVLDVLEPLRLSYIYALKDSHPEELPEDFKKYKWDGYEIEYVEGAIAAYRALLRAMEAAQILEDLPDGP